MTDTNGLLQAPTNFFAANSNLLNASVATGGGGGGGSGSGFPLAANGNLAGFALTNGGTLQATNINVTNISAGNVIATNHAGNGNALTNLQNLTQATNIGDFHTASNSPTVLGALLAPWQAYIGWYRPSDGQIMGGAYYNQNHSGEPEMQFDGQGSASFTYGEDQQGKADVHFGGSGYYHSFWRMQYDNPNANFGNASTNLLGQSSPFGFTFNVYSNAIVTYYGAWRAESKNTNGDYDLVWHDAWNPPSSAGWNQIQKSPFPDHIAGGINGSNIFWNNFYASNNITVGGTQLFGATGLFDYVGNLEIWDKPDDVNETQGLFIVNGSARQVIVGRLSTTTGASDGFKVRDRFGNATFFVDPTSSKITLGNGFGQTNQNTLDVTGVSTFWGGITLPTTPTNNDVLVENASGVVSHTSAPSINGANITNVPIVSSATIPMGAWFTNNVADGATLTPATAMNITNTGDNFAFVHGAFTNVINSRFALPYDWDGSAIQIGLRTFCTGTNASTATNITFGIRAAAIGTGNTENTLTWGALVKTTNHIATNAFVASAETITSPITVGNSPSSLKSILWQIQRLGSDAGDTETNANLVLTEVRIYYRRNTQTNFPAATP